MADQEKTKQQLIEELNRMREGNGSQPGRDEKKLEYLNVLETNLNNITSPFINKLSIAYKNLSPRELQVAALIKQGKSSKDIANIFNLSVGTVNSYRNSMNLVSSETNLRPYLLALT